MIERGDMRSLFKQYAMQGLIFGMHSVPGWQQMQDYTFRSWDGEKSLDDQVSERMGRGMYDVVMNGPLWSVPKLFDGHGFGLYTRGDANIRPALGQINNLTQLPVVGLAKSAYDGLAATMKLISAGGNDQAAFEALVRSSPNRPIRGLLEVLQGYATDRGGQMTFDATQDWSAGLYRLLGAKTSTEIEAARLSWQIKGVEAKRRAEIAKLRVEAQAYIRAGDYEKLNEFAERYVTKGGNLESFNRWFKETARMAVATRSDRELAKAMKNADSFNQLVQLSDAMTSR